MTRTRLALLGICAALVLSACGGDPVAPPPLTLPTSSSATVSESPKPESAEEFIRRWITASNEAQASGDTTAYRELYSGCTPCEMFADQVDRIYANGGYIRTEGERVLRIKRQPEMGRYAFDYWVDAAPTRYVEAEGKPVQRLSGGETKQGVSLRKISDGWIVVDAYRRPE